MRLVSVLITGIVLFVTAAYVYYRQWYNPYHIAIVVSWGSLTALLAVASYFHAIPLTYVIIATIVYGLLSSVLGWHRRKTKSSARLVFLTIAIIPVFVYVRYLNNDNLSLPMHEWSVGSYIVATLLTTMFVAIFVI